jgi:hypothetical protein
MGNRHGAALHPAGSRRRADCRRARTHGAKHLHLRAPCAPWRGPSPLPRRQADPRRALAVRGGSPAGLGDAVARGRGKGGSRFPFPPGGATAPSPPHWQGPSPLPRHRAGIRTDRGPKPPASARPATGGRFAPAGSGAGLCVSWTDRSTGDRPTRAGKRAAFPVPARTGEDTFTFPPDLRTAPSPLLWQGPSPLPQRRAGIRTGRGPKPPASARPALGGRFAPAGSGAGLCPSRICRSTGHCPARAGETRVAFPVPARTGDSTFTASIAGAIAPATAPRWHQDRPGAQSPRPAPAPPPAGASPPPGRALASVPPGPAGLRGAVPRGRGKRDACPLPARTDDSTLTASMAGAIAPATAPRWHQDRPGAKAPGQRPAPPTAGASPPPGRALASASPGPAGLRGAVPRGRGKRGSRLRVPPGGAPSSPGTQRTPRPASGKIAVSVPGQSETGSRAASGVGSGAASAMATIAARSGSTDRSAS